MLDKIKNIKFYEIIFVILIFLFFYFTDRHLPSENNIGFYGGFDQSLLYKSVNAFYKFDFSQSEHHYPIFYSLIASLFLNFSDYHPFLFIDILCIGLSYFIFRLIAINFISGKFFALPIIFLVSLVPYEVGGTLLSPNTIKISMVCIFVLIFLTYNVHKHKKLSVNQFFMLGFITAILLFSRPFDLFAISPIYLLILYYSYNSIFKFSNFSSLILGFFIISIPIILILYQIHGYNFSNYHVSSVQIGFNYFGDFLKKYNIYVNSSIYLDTPFASLLNTNFWTYLFLPSIIVLFRVHNYFLIILYFLIINYFFLYSSYNDMLPGNFIKYGTIRYIVWSFPFMLLIIIYSVKNINHYKINFIKPLLLLTFFLLFESGLLFHPMINYVNDIATNKLTLSKNNNGINILFNQKEKLNKYINYIQIDHQLTNFDQFNMFYGYQGGGFLNDISINDQKFDYKIFRSVLTRKYLKIFLIKDFSKSDFKILIPKYFYSKSDKKYLINRIKLGVITFGV